MIALLLALQISTTSCVQTTTGGQSCITTGGNTHYVDPDWGTAFKQARDRRIKSAVGKLLANGDCEGALQYALRKGRLDLADAVRAYCAH